MAPPIDAREKLGTALRQALTQMPLSKISVSALTRAAGGHPVKPSTTTSARLTTSIPGFSARRSQLA